MRSLFTLTTYVRREMAVLTGQPIADPDASASGDAGRWARVRNALERARNVFYGRHSILTGQGLFDLAENDATDANWAALDACIRVRPAPPGWFDHVVRERCKTSGSRSAGSASSAWRLGGTACLSGATLLPVARLLGVGSDVGRP
jgi:hypothetical protein